MSELKTQLENTTPLGWVQVLICDVLEVHYGKGLRKSDRNETGQVPVYGSSGIVGYHTQALTDGACIVIGRKGSVGTVYLSNVSCWPIDTTYFSQPPDGISLKYAYYALLFLNLGSLDQSTTIPGLNRNDLYAQSLPLAPREEQKRIVDELEKQFTRLDMAVSTLQKVLLKLERLRAAILKAACEGKLVPQEPNDEPADILLERILEERRRKWEEEQWAKQIEKAKKKAAKATRKAARKPLKRGEKLADEEWQNLPESIYGKYLPKNDNWKQKYQEPTAPDITSLPELPRGWCWTTVEQIGTIGEQTVLTGPFGSNLGRRDFITSGVPVLTIGSLTEQGLNLEKAFYVSKQKASELEKYRVKEGDLLFSRMASVGRVGIVPHHLEGALINYHLMRLRLVETLISPGYFILYIRGSHTVTDYINKVNHGATRDGINTSQLLALPVALPTMKEQIKMVEKIDQYLSYLWHLEEDVKTNLTRAERLRQSILKKAFSGALVPQDPTDEPATVLLSRIRKERKKRAQEEKVLKPRQKGGRVKKETRRRSLYQLLVQAEEPISAVELLHRAGFKPETIDEFYEELRKEVPERIKQIRPNKADVYLKAVVNET